ncbi:hypothetical protein LguiA_009433 [Lonicera macranthoides]
MKKKKLEINENYDQQNLEIIKAVAQAWQAHSTNTRPSNEFDAHRLNFKSKPSRFKLEAMSLNAFTKDISSTSGNTRWDFGQSLWDSYEIVNVSKKLEAGLVLDHQFDDPSRLPTRRKESKNSLRNLLNLISSRRFNEAAIPRD